MDGSVLVSEITILQKKYKPLGVRNGEHGEERQERTAPPPQGEGNYDIIII